MSGHVHNFLIFLPCFRAHFEPVRKMLSALLDKFSLAILLRLGFINSHKLNGELTWLPESRYFTSNQIQIIRNLYRSYLKPSGWWISALTRRSIDGEGLATPWLTYAFNHYLSKLDLTNKRILEFGPGASTVFFCATISTYYLL